VGVLKAVGTGNFSIPDGTLTFISIQVHLILFGLKNDLTWWALCSWKNFECQECYFRKPHGPGVRSLPGRGEIWSAYNLADIFSSLKQKAYTGVNPMD